MRIRSTKPEFWRSRRVASVSWDARFVLKGLESYVDDNGVGKDDIELICGDLFSRDLAREGSRLLARVSEAISDLHQAGLVWRYEHEGRPLLYISNWESIQRVDKPQPGRNPRPDGTSNYKDSIIRESTNAPREASRSLAPGTGEQGNRGTGEQSSTSEADASDEKSVRDDVQALCEHLSSRLTENDVKHSIGKGWHDAARLLIDRDRRDLDEARRLIDWATSDSFWRTNILSMPKFREKYDQIRLKAQEKGASNVRPLPSQRPGRAPRMSDFTTEEWLALPVEQRAAIAQRGQM